VIVPPLYVDVVVVLRILPGSTTPGATENDPAPAPAPAPAPVPVPVLVLVPVPVPGPGLENFGLPIGPLVTGLLVREVAAEGDVRVLVEKVGRDMVAVAEAVPEAVPEPDVVVETEAEIEAETEIEAEGVLIVGLVESVVESVVVENVKPIGSTS
jgi:hypothetical protein